MQVQADRPTKIDIIINTYNRDSDLRRCLDSLVKQTCQNFRIIIVDNGNSAIAEHYADKLIRDQTRKLSYLFNFGWRAAESEIIAYIADDAEAEPQWLESILSAFASHPRAGAVSGPTISSIQPAGEMQRLYELATRSWWLKPIVGIYEHLVMEGKLFEPGHLCESGAYSMGAALPRSTHLANAIEVDLLTTTNMGIKRRVLEELGGFDQNFFFNHADGDLFVRAKRKGYQLIFDPKIIVTHYVRPGPSRNAFYIGRDTAFFLLKDVRPHSLKGWVAYIINILVLTSYWVYTAAKTRDIHQLDGIKGFIQGLIDYYSHIRSMKLSAP